MRVRGADLWLWATWATAAMAEEPPPAPSTSEQAPMDVSPARLTWSLSRSSDGAALEIAYTVTSAVDRTIYLCDALPLPGETSLVLGRDFINVAGGGDGDVRFVRGRLPSVAPVVIPLLPGCRPLAPGASLTGTARVSLPLKPAHYHGRAAPFLGTPTRAWLEIGWVEADAQWQELALEDGRKLTTPGFEDAQGTLTAGPLPLP